jgi:uncharacterized protein (DUF362 family)
MDRREFLKQTAKALAASAVIGGGTLLLGSRQGDNGAANPEAFDPAKYHIDTDPSRPLLVAAKSTDWTAATAAAVAALGGIETFITRGDKVCLKPNIGWDRTPELGANTHPDVVAEMTRLCLKAGASKVVVVDVTCNNATRTYNRSGIKAAAEAAGAQVLIATDNLFTEVDFGADSLGHWQMLTPILECDKLINMPVVKHHSLSGMTASLKNWFGALTGPRNRLHQGIDDNLVDLGKLFRPTLTVADATRVLQRNGPTGGNIDDVIIYNTIVASVNQVAIEAYVTRFLSKTPANFPFIKMADEAGVGISNPPKDKIAEIAA